MTRIVLPLLLLTLVYFGIRAPFFSQQLVEEEGLHAKVFYDHPPGPNYMIAARVGGIEYFDPSQHPGALCKMISLLGKLTCRILDCSSLSEFRATTILRVVFSLFQYLVWVLLMLTISLRAHWRPPLSLWLLFGALTISPLAFSSSLTIHLDGSHGALMCGLASLALLNAQLSTASSAKNASRLLIFAATMYLGLGKNPWNIALAAAIVFTFTWCLILSGLRRDVVTDLATTLAGCLVGNICSYLLDPPNYTMSWNLTLFVGKAHSIFSTPFGSSLRIMLKRLPFLLPQIILLGLVALIASRSGLRRMSHWHVLNIAFSCALFFGPCVSMWGVEPRYFAPSLIAMAIVSIGLLAESDRIRTASMSRAVAAAIILLALEPAVFFSIAHFKHRSVTMAPLIYRLQGDREAWRSCVPKDKSCVPRLDTAYAYREPDVDFVGAFVDQGYAEDLVKKHGKVLCSR